MKTDRLQGIIAPTSERPFINEQSGNPLLWKILRQRYKRLIHKLEPSKRQPQQEVGLNSKSSGSEELSELIKRFRNRN